MFSLKNLARKGLINIYLRVGPIPQTIYVLIEISWNNDAISSQFCICHINWAATCANFYMIES